MDWKTAMREMTKESIYAVEHEHTIAYGYDEGDETNLDAEFPCGSQKVVIINGEKHILNSLFWLDGELPAQLKYSETNSQFDPPELWKWISERMLNETSDC